MLPRRVVSILYFGPLGAFGSQQSPTIAAGQPLFLLYDGHGSTRALVDALGLPLTGQIYRYEEEKGSGAKLEV